MDGAAPCLWGEKQTLTPVFLFARFSTRHESVYRISTMEIPPENTRNPLMADPRFFTKAGPFTLAQLAESSGAQLASGAEASMCFNDVAPLHDAGPEQVSFLANKK